MRIAVIYQYIYPQSFGGGEKRLYEIFSRFPAESQVDWYVQYQADYKEYQELIDLDIFNLQNKMKASVQRSYVETISFCWQLLWKVDLKKYDIVHTGQMPFFHIMFLFFKKFFLIMTFQKTPLITIDWWEYWGKYWKEKYPALVAAFGKVIEKTILFFAGYLVVISKKTQQDIKPYTIAEVALIHNGVNLAVIDAAVPFEKKYDVIIFGRVEAWKNPQMGVYVFEQMLKKNPALEMVIVGDGSYSETLQKYVKDNGMDNNVDFYGFAKDDDEVYGLIKSAKLMMQFSKQEGGGSITLFEANACGIPVATASFENGIDELLVTDKNGFYFKNHDHNYIADELLKYLADSNRQGQVELSCREFVTEFDWNLISKEYLKFFKKIIKERS